MKYRVRNKSYGYDDNMLHEFLASRGVEDPVSYSSLTDEVLHDFTGLSGIDEAADCLKRHIECESDIAIIVDSDMDGYCSSGIMYRYLVSKGITPKYFLHPGKQHGFEGIDFPSDTTLIISPDGGSNDVALCKEYAGVGIDIIILDHHQIEVDNPHAIVVNPQNCDYPNKELSGGAVVYKFIQAMDNLYGDSEADNYLDLAAFSIISDSMDVRSPESRRIIEKGFENIQSEMILALLDKQSYSIKNIFDPTIVDVQFYIAPLINGMVRSGSQENKELMFRGFAGIHEEFDYIKRDKSEIKETTYVRVARLCSNAKAKQNKNIDKEIKIIDKKIEEKNLQKNKILVVNGTKVSNKNFTGLIAMKLASKYNMPCLVISKWGKDSYGGSGRNVFGCEIEDLKELLKETGFFEWANGHPNAFGLKIDTKKIKPMISHLNEKLKDVSFDPFYKVDFVFQGEDVTSSIVENLNEISKYQGQGIEESLSLVENLEINLSNVELMGAKKDTWRIDLESDVSFIKFKCEENDEMLMLKNDEWGGGGIVKINAIVSFSISSFNGIITPQGIIKDYEVVR